MILHAAWCNIRIASDGLPLLSASNIKGFMDSQATIKAKAMCKLTLNLETLTKDRLKFGGFLLSLTVLLLLMNQKWNLEAWTIADTKKHFFALVLYIQTYTFT